MDTQPQPPLSDAAPRVGTHRFERLLVPIVGVFGLLFSLQCMDAFVADWPSMANPLGVVVDALLALGVVFGLVAAAGPSRIGKGMLLGAVLSFVGALLVWPFAMTGPLPAELVPWPLAVWGYYAACLVTIERKPVVPLVVSVVVGADMALVLWSIGGIPLLDSIVDGAQVVAFTVVMWTLVALVRRSVATADRAQEAALGRYAAARLQTATEQERVRTDALVNDSVLTTFLSAAAARTAEAEALAARMAQNALRILARVERADAAGDLVAFGKALSAMRAEHLALMQRFERHVDTGALALVVPQSAADALVAAMVEAMDNSVRHAGDCSVRTLQVSPLGHDGVQVVVRDDGAGFDADVPRRGGGTVAAVTRVRAVEGFARIDSRPGHGTAVLLAWGSSVTPDGAWNETGQEALAG